METLLTTTYRDIKRQIADLEKKAAEARKIEVGKAIAGIQQLIAEYALTPEDLFGTIRKSGAKVSKAATKVVKPAKPPKYMDPKSAKTWSGFGKAPGWIAAAIKKGKKDDFLLAKVEAQRAAAQAPKPTTPKKAVKAAGAKPVAAPSAKKAAAAKPAASSATKSKATGATAAKKMPAPKKAAPTPVKKPVAPKKTNVVDQAAAPVTPEVAVEPPAA